MTNHYFIRHAEKNQWERTTDPHLTEKGKERAERWAAFFKDKKIDQIYCTHYKRTWETARPTAEYFGISIQTYQGIIDFVEKFKSQTRGKNVLIVGHQDKTPHFVNMILGEEKYKMIPAEEHGRLYHLKFDESQKLIKEELSQHS